MVYVGVLIVGHPGTGYHYTNIGHHLFPFPSTDSVLLPAFTPVPPVEAFVYTIFIYQGLWIAWASLGIAYILLPFSFWVYRALRKSIKHAQEHQKQEERVGVTTGMLAFLSIYLSIGTFSISSTLYIHGPIPFLIVVALSVIIVGLLIQSR